MCIYLAVCSLATYHTSVVSHLPEVVDVGLLDVGDVPVPQVVDDPREVDVPRQRPRNVLQKEIRASATTDHDLPVMPKIMPIHSRTR